MNLTWMLLMAIVIAWSVSYNFATVIPNAISIKKDHLVVMASEVKVLKIVHWHFQYTHLFLNK